MSDIRIPSKLLLGKQVAANPRAGSVPAVYYVVQSATDDAVVCSIHLSNGVLVGRVTYSRRFFDHVFSITGGSA